MKSLHLISNMSQSGPSQVLVDIAYGLTKIGVDCFVAGDYGKLARKLDEMGVSFFHLPGLNRSYIDKGNYSTAIFQLIKSINIVRKIVLDEDIDIIHVHQRIPVIVGIIVSKMTGVPMVTHLHNKFNFSKYSMKLYRFGDFHIAVSNQVKETIEESFSLNGIKVVQNSIRVSEFLDTRVSSADLSEYGISANDFVVGSVCGIRPQKGLEYLVEAANIVCDYGSNINFVVAGGVHKWDEKYYDGLLDKVSSYNLGDNFVFLGERRDIKSLLKRFDIFVLSSLYEGLPISLLEAGASGCPCVATEVSGSEDVIVHGDSGYLVPSMDSDAIAHSIKVLFDFPELRKKFGENLQKRITKYFNVEKNSKKIYKIYRNLL